MKCSALCLLFGYLHVVAVTAGETEATPERQLNEYLQLLNASDPKDLSLAVMANSDRFWQLSKLFSRLLCCPATSAPVERVFSQSGLLMRAHRARMSDPVLETLVFLKCNCHI